MPGIVTQGNETDGQTTVPKKLVLCFDGTGNTFTGSSSDTNVVKILRKFDRNAPDQFHYYQTGIGTYDSHDESVNKSFVGEMKSSIAQTIDQGIGTTFDAHVMAGYRFLMRYYDSGDKIYMFGFSRGAFTAKFLARMINTVGLLCKGNEEMVPFAYRLYQRYLAGEVKEFIEDHPRKLSKDTKHKSSSLDTPPPTPPFDEDDRQRLNETSQESPGPVHDHEFEVARDELAAFSDTLCRKEEVMHCGKMKETNIKVFFLGIWDCVNSVAVLERNAPVPVPVVGTAHHVRHAVAVDERRVKFKAALLAQDIRESDEHHHEDIQEVWFPGCHGDVGGGWPADDNDDDGGKQHCESLQLSDIPLAWMISQVEQVGQKYPDSAIRWRENVNTFKAHFTEKKEQALKGKIHDALAFNCGTNFVTVMFWKLMEWLPFITRWELENAGWQNVRFPLNKGSTRDIPKDAVLHESVLWRLTKDSKYCPQNNHGGRLLPCLKHMERIVECCPATDPSLHDPNCEHATFKIKRSASDLGN